MISLFNTATGKIEELDTSSGSVSLYVCGVTPYDTTHLGHAFTYVTFDVLVRFLESQGIEVTYVQNVTDIDDDILRKARELGVDWHELGLEETQRYLEDMAALNVRPPDHLVPATDVMSQIVEAILALVRAGKAYQAGGNVYFDSRSFPSYGQLCHCDREQMLQLAEEHGGSPADPAKHDPLDFVLWLGHRPNEPQWPGPFGPGRPGWHIECSTTATKYLPTPIDIHGGGRDLIFPHHASEIAQAESLRPGTQFARLWMHTAMVTMDGEKMSKSLGNMAFVRDLLQTYSADAIRLYLLSHHYRKAFEYQEKELARAAELAHRLERVLAEQASNGNDQAPRPARAIGQALAEDLNTPAVVDRLYYLSEQSEARRLNPEEVGDLRWSAEILGLRLATRVPAGCGGSR